MGANAVRFSVRKQPVTIGYRREICEKHLARIVHSASMTSHRDSDDGVRWQPVIHQRIRCMKNVLKAATIASLFVSFATFAHHPAADIVDPEIYEMIDDNVADTPHADLTFDDMGR